jgi:hypothetical protein
MDGFDAFTALWIGGKLKSCAVAVGDEREEESHWDGGAELIVGSHLGSLGR